MDIAVIRKNTVEITEKELKIVAMLSNGKRTKDIADSLTPILSVRTVESMLDKLRDKVGAKTQPHLVAIFIRKNLIK